MSTERVLERAFELARSGTCRDMVELELTLKREGFEQVHEHIRGPGTYIPSSSSSTTTGMVGTVPFNATTTRQGPGVYIPPRPANTSVSDPILVDFLVPVGQQIPFEGYVVTVTKADPVSLTYNVQKGSE